MPGADGPPTEPRRPMGAHDSERYGAAADADRGAVPVLRPVDTFGAAGASGSHEIDGYGILFEA